MMSMEFPTYLDTGSPHGLTPTSPSFNVAPVTRQQNHLRSRSHSRPDTPNQQAQNNQSIFTNVSLEPPAGTLLVDFLRQWDDAHVSRWLAEIKCPQLAQTFAANDLRGDILLDLDQNTLKEMGIVAVGDRIKIMNAVKALRAKVSSSKPPKNTQSQFVNDARPHATKLRVEYNSTLTDTSSPPRRRLDPTRPPPLQLSGSAALNSPPIIWNSASSRPPNIPVNPGHTHTHSGSSTKDSYGTIRGLPPLPPPPRMQLPTVPRNVTSPQQQNVTPTSIGSRSLLPPQVSSGRRTPTPAESPPPFTKDPLPPAPNHSSTPLNSPWSGEYGVPRGPSPGNVSGTRVIVGNRSNSPLPMYSSRTRPPVNSVHGRSASATHPYASLQASLQPPLNSSNSSLSPIRERDDFLTSSSSTVSPCNPTGSSHSSRGPLRPSTPSSRTPMTAEDIRRKCVKFVLAEGGHSRLLNVEDKLRGAEILEFVLRKFGNAGNISFPSNNSLEDLDSINPDEPLVVDGWGVFLGEGDNPGMLLHVLCSFTI